MSISLLLAEIVPLKSLPNGTPVTGTTVTGYSRLLLGVTISPDPLPGVSKTLLFEMIKNGIY